MRTNVTTSCAQANVLAQKRTSFPLKGEGSEHKVPAIAKKAEVRLTVSRYTGL
mgnify:FL=1